MQLKQLIDNINYFTDEYFACRQYKLFTKFNYIVWKIERWKSKK